MNKSEQEMAIEAPWTDAEMWDGNHMCRYAFQQAPCRSCSATLGLPRCVRNGNVMPPGTDGAKYAIATNAAAITTTHA